jgi:hypothetical protein
MFGFDNISSQWDRNRVERKRTPQRRWMVHPACEELEKRLTLSGGGFISSTQFGQSGDGLLGQYYDNTAFSGTPSFTRWDDRIDFSWADGNAYPGGSPDPSFNAVGPGGWSARWTGQLTASINETYTFSINSAGNSVRLWVTPVGQPLGNPLIGDETVHGQTTDTATLALQVGQAYNVELDSSQNAPSAQQVQLLWSSPSSPSEDIEPATQVGLNVTGGDALFANLVNGGTRSTWLAPDEWQTIPADSNNWPESDGRIFLEEGDSITSAGGAYLVQFAGLATVTDWPQAVDWWVDGTDLQSSTLQTGEGYDPETNTTTATMVVSPGSDSGLYLSFTNTSRTATPSMGITAAEATGDTLTVSVPSVAGISPGQKAVLSGSVIGSAGHDGTFVITSVNPVNNSFTFTDQNALNSIDLIGGSVRVIPGIGNGITNLYVMQPSSLGGDTPLPVGTLFTPAALAMTAQYSTLRLMDLQNTNNNLTSDWSDRTLVSDNFWSSIQFNSGTGVDTDVSDAAPLAGVPWEIQVALANETGKDIYINIPSNASNSYIKELSDLFVYGSDGINAYTSTQSDPVWKPLNSNLKVYIEFSNETWNYAFAQAATGNTGWINQLSQRALYDYLTVNQNDPLYPGGGSNAYDDGAILDSYYKVDASDEAAFLASYNPNPAPSIYGTSPPYFNNSTPINGYGIGESWVGLRDVQISNAFKTAFGESNLDAVDPSSRVRPVYEWQYGGGWSGALDFIEGTFGAQHPVNYYLYAGGGGWYGPDAANGFSDVSFANPAFANGLSGWSSSGSAGVVANGSTLGNPDAPPSFSAIAVNGGATESGNTVTITTTTPHDLSPGETVEISGVILNGFDGTFTIASVTSNTFTYTDTESGLSDSGDGMVTGTASSNAAAYLQPGASIRQNVTFSGGYADITLYAGQTVPEDGYGLSIILTPIDGGPAINDGQPILVSQGATLFSGSQNAFTWACSEAFYTGDKNYTYSISFVSTLPSGTIFLDGLAIQTVNGMFNETTAALQDKSLGLGGPNISDDIQSDVGLALEYGLNDVSYEGGFFFGENLSTGGYTGMGGMGYSSNVPNVAMYANLDPRTEALAIDTLDQFYAAGGTLPLVYESSGNINSWAVAAPYYFDWDTPKQQAVAFVEAAPHPATDGLKPGQSEISSSWALQSGQSLNSTWVLPVGSYAVTVSFGPYGVAPAGQSVPVEILVDGQLIETEQVSSAAATSGGSFIVLLGSLAAGPYSVELIDTATTGNHYLIAPSYSVSLFSRAIPTVQVAAGGGVYSGSPFAAGASVAGTGGVSGASLEGAALVLTYYVGAVAAGPPLAGPPSAACSAARPSPPRPRWPGSAGPSSS